MAIIKVQAARSIPRQTSNFLHFEDPVNSDVWSRVLPLSPHQRTEPKNRTAAEKKLGSDPWLQI